MNRIAVLLTGLCCYAACSWGDTPSGKVAMRTPWGEKLQTDSVWPEYPRPQLKRADWRNLNGYWQYAVTAKDQSNAPEKWDGQILVPFALEAPLSGVERRLAPDEALWYQRTFSIEQKKDRRYLLNFEAVDYQSTLWVNGKEIGTNTGGNQPFSFDITDALAENTNTLTLKVTDATDTPGAYQLHGKQRLHPEGIWYTPVSGIWQTVWIEEVPEDYVRGLKITPKLDGMVTVDIITDGDAAPEAKLTASYQGKIIAQESGNGTVSLKIPDPQLWSPEQPALYDLKVELGTDVVESYFGIRESSRARDENGHWRLTLNGKPIFQLGTLDQGWWPDGLLTPPSDEALRSDIEFLKAAGFNTIRKHIKVEPRRFYEHCDRIGILVWQDQVSNVNPEADPPWTRLAPDPKATTWPEGAHKQYMKELRQMVDGLYNHPSIVQWVPFNEAWGQHQTVEVGNWLAEYDPSRLVNVASGGNFWPAGHIVDFHSYPHPAFPFSPDNQRRFADYVLIVGEFGGHGYPVQGHVWNPKTRNWGYGTLPKNKEEWLERYRTSMKLLAELKEKGIAAGIYTQTTDVEGEINGLLTYDRKVQKVPPEKLAEIHREYKLVGNESTFVPLQNDRLRAQ